VTPTQLRAFACVVRLGSVKAAAKELAVSEAAVSMHVAQLRKEFDDLLFTRASSGLAFTPGGLRLASRAVEILGLQDRTVREVSQAGHGRRVLRLACTSLFAEHAAPGLIDLFAARADDLEVELSVRPVEQLASLLLARAADVAVGPVGPPRDDVDAISFLRYEVVAAARPGHPLADHPVSSAEVRRATWALGPAAVGTTGVMPTVLRRLNVPEKHQRIFQSQAAAIEETKGSDAVTLAVRFAIGADVAARRLAVLDGPGLRAQGSWSAMALPGHSQIPVAAELMRFITTPRATQAMVKGAGVDLGRFRPTIHVTLWS
jgi:LysR family transcriptional regulator, low CO2-responsive transcriptional regulator